MSNSYFLFFNNEQNEQVAFIFVTVAYNIGLKYVVEQLLHVLYHGEVSKV